MDVATLVATCDRLVRSTHKQRQTAHRLRLCPNDTSRIARHHSPYARRMRGSGEAANEFACTWPKRNRCAGQKTDPPGRGNPGPSFLAVISAYRIFRKKPCGTDTSCMAREIPQAPQWRSFHNQSPPNRPLNHLPEPEASLAALRPLLIAVWRPAHGANAPRCAAAVCPSARPPTRTRSLQHYLGHRNIHHTVRYTELSAHRFKDFWR